MPIVVDARVVEPETESVEPIVADVVEMIEPAMNWPLAVVEASDAEEVAVRVPRVPEPILPCPIVAFEEVRV